MESLLNFFNNSSILFFFGEGSIRSLFLLTVKTRQCPLPLAAMSLFLWFFITFILHHFQMQCSWQKNSDASSRTAVSRWTLNKSYIEPALHVPNHSTITDLWFIFFLELPEGRSLMWPLSKIRQLQNMYVFTGSPYSDANAHLFICAICKPALYIYIETSFA